MDRIRYLIGLITLAAAVFGGWYLLGLLRGEEAADRFHLRIEFSDARGLRPGADVRLRGVPVGIVKSVDVSEDGSKAVVGTLLEPGAAEHARVHSAFWIVTPRFTGITSGASGLDTLVRDSYLSFLTPDPAGPALADGSLITGLDAPPPAARQTALPPTRHGDLLMELLVPENHGLKAGSEVRLRGMTTGEVRAVRLHPDGTHVVVDLRIARRFRHTVTGATEFWIARPTVSVELLHGISVEEAGALLSPYVAYYTHPGSGLPVENGHRAAATAERPRLDVSPVPGEALSAATADRPAGANAGLQVVRVEYHAVEDDVLSADDEIRRHGSGVLFADGEGNAMVLTARSACDAGWTERDLFGGAPDILQEEIKVLCPDGPVLRAGRNWVDPEGRDLALLRVEAAPPGLAVTPPGPWSFDEDAPTGDGAVALRACGERARPREPHPLTGDGLPALEEWRGAVLVRAEGGVVSGLLGQSAWDDPAPTLIGLDAIPDSLRPTER